MNKSKKSSVYELIEKGKTQTAIEYFRDNAQEQAHKNYAYSMLSEFQQLQQKVMQGVISAEEERIVRNQITKRLMALVNEEELPSTDYKELLGNKNRLRWGVLLVFVSLFSVWAIKTGIQKDIEQLTVYVTDLNGNVVLEYEGELHIPLGNRPLNAKIGEDGRTNFGDIPARYLGEPITIGLNAEGWKIANGEQEFSFTGKPIFLKVQRDNSLGIIKGTVKSRDGQQFLPNAEIRVNADTVIYTDYKGIFKITLPIDMQIKRVEENYLLTVSKDGYRTKTQYHNPKSSDAEIRLDKQ
jgi:hypothetical protein